MTTVCGSDLHLLTGDLIQLKKGDIVGHEVGGIIESVGNDVKHFKVGDVGSPIHLRAMAEY